MQLMNNTKWRELLLLMHKFYPMVEVAFIDDEHFHEYVTPTPDMLKETLIADPGFGGPIEYKSIFSLRVPIHQNVRNPVSGVVTKDISLSEQFVSAVNRLGNLPIDKNNDFIFIHGYQK